MGEEVADELQPNAVALTTKALLLEVYHDMKFVRPAVEGLLSVGVAARLEKIERDAAIASAAGVAPTLVERVSALERHVSDEAARGAERGRIGDLSGKALAAIILVSNFILGLVIKGF